jgi:RNA polymerase sigma-70 factor (ECF subfamily)
MHESAGRYPGVLVSRDAALEREFEHRLHESSALAVRVAFSVLRQQQDAEDVAQEAFARAHRHFQQLADPDRFRAWIVRVTWRLAIDRWRSERRRRTREQAAVEMAPPTTAEETAAAAERSDRLWAAIDGLPEKLRVVIVLSAIEGHDIRAVARLLEIPEGTVKSRLFLARKGLAQRLQCLVNDSSTR